MYSVLVEKSVVKEKLRPKKIDINFVEGYERCGLVGEDALDCKKWKLQSWRKAG